MSSTEDLSFDSENKVYMAGDEDSGQETESKAGDYDREHSGPDKNITAREWYREARLSVDVQSANSDTSNQPGSAWSSSSSEEEGEEDETSEDAQEGEERGADENVTCIHMSKTGEERVNTQTSSDLVLDHNAAGGFAAPISSGLPTKRSVDDEPRSLEPFSNFDGAWCVDSNENTQCTSVDHDTNESAAANEVSTHPRHWSEAAEDSDADDESSPNSLASAWQAQEHLAVERRPHLRGRRLSIMDQYKYNDNDDDLQRRKGNIETAIKRAIQRIDPAKQKIVSLDAYDRPHEGLERMGDPRVKAHLRPGEHANTPRKPSPLRRYEDGEAVANETDVAEPRSPECILLPKITREEKLGWSSDDTRRHLEKKWHPDAKDKMLEDVDVTSTRLAELLHEEPGHSAMLDRKSLAELLRASHRASASNDSGIRRAYLILDSEAGVKQHALASTSGGSADPKLDTLLSLSLAVENKDTHVVSPIDSDANGHNRLPLPSSAQELEVVTGTDTQEALALAQKLNRRFDTRPLAQSDASSKSEDAADRLARKRTEAEFEWDYDEYQMRRQGYELSPRLKLPENQKERAEYARAMAHHYRYELDGAQRKAAFLLERAKDAGRLRRERDKLLKDVSDYKKAIGQNFTEIAILEEKLRQRCQHCGQSRKILQVDHIDVAADGNTLRCLDSSHAELEQELTAARERIQALHEKNEGLEASLGKSKAKITELKAFTLSWKQRAEAAQAQAEHVQELADCELLRRAKESSTTDRGTDPDESAQRAYEEKIAKEAKQQLERQYDELMEKYDDCKKRLEQTIQNHHDDLRKSGVEQRQLRTTMAQLEHQRASLESQLQQIRHRQRELYLSPAGASDQATPASTQRPSTPPVRASGQNSDTPSMKFTHPTPPKIDTDVDSTLQVDDTPIASARTPSTPGLAAFLADQPPATPAMARSESWHKRNARVLQSRAYQEVKKRLEAHREEQRKTELREKELREKAYLDTFGVEFKPLSVSEKKETYYRLTHKSKHVTERPGVEQCRSQERIRQKCRVESTYREDSEARLSASRDDYNARSPTKPYQWTAPGEEDNHPDPKRRLWGSGGGVKHRYA